MRIPRPAAEKLGVDRQDPDLDGLLLGLIRRATGGCHEHAARLDHLWVIGAGRGLTNDKQPILAANLVGRQGRTFAFLGGARLRKSV